MGEELEIWDLCDANKKPLGRTHVRKDPLGPDEYHLVVIAFIRNSRGEYLLTRRVPEKVNGGLLEITGGSALSGESSIEAMIREIHEETGLCVTEDEGKLIHTHVGVNFISDCYYFSKDFNLDDVVFQPGETCGATKATAKEMLEMEKDGRFVPFSYLKEVLDKIEALS